MPRRRLFVTDTMRNNETAPMLKRSVLFAMAILAAAIATAEAQTQQQQSACSRDASRLCRRVLNDGDMAVLSCLKANRPKVSATCGALIDQH